MLLNLSISFARIFMMLSACGSKIGGAVICDGDFWQVPSVLSMVAVSIELRIN
jgi:hypothetical protein